MSTTTTITLPGGPPEPAFVNISSGNHILIPSIPQYRTARDFTFEGYVQYSQAGVIASSMTGVAAASGPSFDYVLWCLDTRSVSGVDTLFFTVRYFMPSSEPAANGSPAWWYQNCVHSVPLKPVNGWTPLFDNRWHHVAAVIRGYRLSLFLDGDLLGVSNFETSLTQAGAWSWCAPGTSTAGAVPAQPQGYQTQPQFFGGPGSGPSIGLGWDSGLPPAPQCGQITFNPLPVHAQGGVDEVHLWSVALSAADIRMHQFTGLKGNEPGLIGWYTFDGDSQEAGSLFDSSPSDNTASAVTDPGSPSGELFSPGGFIPLVPQCVKLSGGSSYLKVAGNSAFDFGGNDFTAVIWIQPGANQAGPILSRQDSSGAGWALILQPEGTFSFFTCDGVNPALMLNSGNTSVFDGAWHHVAVMRGQNCLSIWFDGKRIKQSLPMTSGVNVSLNPTTEWPFCVGTSNCALGTGTMMMYPTSATGGTYQQSPACSVDEPRIWKRSLSADEIEFSMHHLPNQNDPGVVAAWTLDGTLAAQRGSSAMLFNMWAGNTYAPAVVLEAPTDSPYLLTQALLTQDYDPHASNSTTADITTYRVILSPRTKDHIARASKLTINCDSAIKMRVGGTTVSFTPGKSQEFDTDLSNQLTLVVPAIASTDTATQLFAPTFYVRADFMSSTENVMINPDRQLQSSMAAVTGTDLQNGGRGKAPLLDSSFSAQQAADLATTINNAMATAIQQDVQPAKPPGGVAPKLTAAPAGNAHPSADNYHAAVPVPPLYQPPDLCCAHFDEKTHQIKTNYVPTTGSCVRCINPCLMTCPHFCYDLQNRTFTSLTEQQAQQAGVPTTPPAAGTAKDSTWSGWLSDEWHSFVKGEQKALKVVVSAAEKVVHVVITTAEGVFNAIIATVEQAADFVAGLFRSLGIAIDKVVTFFRAVFDLNDVAPIAQVVVQMVEQTCQGVSAVLSGLNTRIDQGISSITTQLTNTLNSWKIPLPLQTTTVGQAGQSASSKPSGNVHTQYLSTTLNENISSLQTMAMPSVALTSAEQDQLNSALKNVPELGNNQKFQQLCSLIMTPEGFATVALDVFLEVIIDLVEVVSTATTYVVDAIFALLQKLLSILQTALTGPLPNIPVITPLFNQHIAPAGIPWSFAGMLGFMTGVMANLSYRLIKGTGAPPLVSAQDAANFAADQPLKTLFAAVVAAPASNAGPTPQTASTYSQQQQQHQGMTAPLGFYLSSPSMGFIQGAAAFVSQIVGAGAGMISDIRNAVAARAANVDPGEAQPLLTPSRNQRSGATSGGAPLPASPAPLPSPPATPSLSNSDFIGWLARGLGWITSAPLPSFVSYTNSQTNWKDNLEIGNWCLELGQVVVGFPTFPQGENVNVALGVVHLALYCGMGIQDLAQEGDSPWEILANWTQNMVGGFPDLAPAIPPIAETLFAFVDIPPKATKAVACTTLVFTNAACNLLSPTIQIGRACYHLDKDVEHWVQ